ncbi:MAG: EamA family transporter, partial [Actinobacteria bacterium]|nr:EamA family transporter [Actinomycetota bacterium]
MIAPITSTDPVWTALFAWLIVGTAFGLPTLAGMVVTVVGVALISRWMDEGREQAAGTAGAGALAAAAHGDVLPDGGECAAGA